MLAALMAESVTPLDLELDSASRLALRSVSVKELPVLPRHPDSD
jgi:hypothetical protein